MTYFDTGINLAFWLTIISTLLCVVYGVLYWNKDAHCEITNVKEWEKEEAKMEKDL